MVSRLLLCIEQQSRNNIPYIKALAAKAVETKEIVLINTLTRKLRLVDVKHFCESFVVIIAI